MLAGFGSQMADMQVGLSSAMARAVRSAAARKDGADERD
jgi:hypothetical protein